MPEASWSDGLAGQALEVVEAKERRLRVRAGPGTGKTFALTRRVMRLLDRGCRPERIFVCTFTRTAARDLQRELERRGASQVYAGTLHSFCFSLLSKAEVLRLTGRVPRPLLKFEERFLLEDLATNGEGIRQLRRGLDALGAAWARLQSDEPGWPQDPYDRSFLDRLLGWLQFHEAMLIAEIVPKALEFVRNNPASPHVPVFDHVLVDEYQDLNRAEQVFLRELAKGGHLVVVGDENQSIYSFKFAHPEGILRFHEENPGTRDIELGECKRCPRLVVDLANMLISNNRTPAPRTLKPDPTAAAGEVYIVQWQSLGEEAEGLARFIEHEVHSKQTAPGNILVLAPRRQIGYAVRDALRRMGIPANSFFYEEALEGDPKDENDAKAQQAFTLLALLAKPDDKVALRCWCGFGSPSLNAGPWKRLRDYCENNGRSPRDVLEDLVQNPQLIPRMDALIDRYCKLRRQLEMLSGREGSSLFDSLFPEGEEWSEGLRKLAPRGEGLTAGDLLEAVRLAIIRPETPTDVDFVRVMSLHKGKGLTAEVVVVAACVEGLIPSLPEDGMSDVEKAGHLEEQRRLFYVAITRTRRVLVLSSVTQLPKAEAHRMRARVGSSGQTVASRFIDELGPSRPKPARGDDWLRSLGVRA